MSLMLRRMGLLVLVGSFVLTLPVVSQVPLNSLVARVDAPRGPIPAECEQGIAPAPPLRVEPRQIEVPVVEPDQPIAPPSGALRTALEETQNALVRNDRPAFNTALARTKALLLTYPSGGERRAAEDVLRLHDAAARLWDLQYEAPFFSESDPEYALVSGLPGYAEAVRRSTLTDDRERRFYPTAESREFVARVAAERLTRLGIRRSSTTVTRTRESAPPRSVQTPRRQTSAAASRPRKSSPSRSSSSSSASTRSSFSSQSSRKPAVANPAPRPPKPAAPPTVAAAPAPATTTMSSPVAGDVAPAPAVPSPAVAAEPTPTLTSPDTATETTLPSTASVSSSATDTAPTTVAETAQATTTDVVPATAPASAQRNILVPAILILVGLGVLIVLFRAAK